MKSNILMVVALLTTACGDSGSGGAGGTGGTPSSGGGGEGATSTSTSGGGGEGAGSTSTTGGGGEGATSTTGSGGTGGGANCNSLVNVGSDVNQVALAGMMPVGVGGTIEDGMYVLSNLETYPTSPLDPAVVFNQTLEVTGTTAELVVNNTGGNNQPEVRKTFTVTTAGIVPTITEDCTTEVPPFPIPYTSFTATSTKITLYSTMYLFSVTYTKVGTVACSNAPVDMLECNTPLLPADFVTPVNFPNPADTSLYLGGTILNGHYELEEYIIHNGSNVNFTIKGGASFCDGTHSNRTALYVNGGMITDDGRSGTIVYGSNTFTAQYLCPQTLGTSAYYYNVEEGGEVVRALFAPIVGGASTEQKYRRIMP